MIRLLRIWIPALLLSHLVCCPAALAAQALPAASQIKSAFVYNVARYVTWPPSDDSSFMIGIFGSGAADSTWSMLKEKKIHGKKVVVIKSNDPDDLLNCQVVFIESSDKNSSARIITRLQDYPILTIGNGNGPQQADVMVKVLTINGHITFSVNLKRAKSSGLEISSNLLKLAVEVTR